MVHAIYKHCMWLLVNSRATYNDACKKSSMDELCNRSQMTAFGFNKIVFVTVFKTVGILSSVSLLFIVYFLTIDPLSSVVGSSKHFNTRFAKYRASPTVNNRIAQRVKENAGQNKRFRTKKSITKILSKKLIHNRRKI